MDIKTTYIVFGLGKSGQAVVRFCDEQGVPCVIVDDNVVKASQWIQEHSFSYPVYASSDFSFHDEVYNCVVSPGVPHTHPFLQQCAQRHIPCTNEVELALQMVKRPLSIIAVTGTNGKTTVVELIAHMLQASGFRVKTLGNIGVAVLDGLKELADWYVMELSSFQLERITAQRIQIGCWLNISPNHLDWHSSMEEYFAAKARLCALIQPGGICVVHDTVGQVTMPPHTDLVRYGTKNGWWLQGSSIMYMDKQIGRLPKQLEFAGKHDQDNYVAALSVSIYAGCSVDKAEASFASFKKPAHRIECVSQNGNISFWDDSKSTNVASTIAAVRAMKEPVVLIAGGVHKGSSYSPWRQLTSLIAIVAFGQSKALIYEDVGDAIPVILVDTLEEAVRTAAAYVEAPHAVLLSPGCSSYDMFTNYHERGCKFQEIVHCIVKG